MACRKLKKDTSVDNCEVHYNIHCSISCSLSTIAYAVPEQQALAWGGGFGFGFGGGSIVQKNICTKAICINKAENQADGFGFGPET
jgi:hypothetical protein